MLARIIFLVAVALAAPFFGVLVAGILTTVGHLVGMEEGPLVILFASTFTTVFSCTITFGVLVVHLLFGEDVRSLSPRSSKTTSRVRRSNKKQKK